jgi:hypothetical protein
MRKSKPKETPPSVDENAVRADHPRAPMRGPSREALIKILRRPDAEVHLPLTLARFSPDAIVRKEGARWVIRKLIEDDEAVKKAYQEAISAEKGFREENTWRFRRPGPIIVEATTKEDFIHAIMKMKWDFGDEDGRGERPFLKNK